MILLDPARDAAAKSLGDILGGSPTIQFETSANAEIATLPMSAAPFGAPAAGVITANAITTDTVATGGTAAKASFYTSGATPTKRYEMSVGTAAPAEIIISSTAIAPNDQVSMSSLKITVPAS